MAKASTASKDVAVREQAGAVAVADFEADAGAGFENQTGADIVIPFLKLMQGLSKEVKAREAMAGQLVNSVTGEAVDEVVIVPAITEHSYIEYRPRDNGGGFVAKHQVGSDVVKAAQALAAKLNRPFGKLYTSYGDDGKPTGNELIETFSLYAVVCDDAEPVGMVCIAFDATDIKFYKKWNTSVASFMLPRSDGKGKFCPPMFSHSVVVTAEEHKYPGGEAYNFVLRPAAGTIRDSLIAASDPRYKAGRDLRDLVNQGLARAAHETMATEASEPKMKTSIF